MSSINFSSNSDSLYAEINTDSKRITVTVYHSGDQALDLDLTNYKGLTDNIRADANKIKHFIQEHEENMKAIAIESVQKILENRKTKMALVDDRLHSFTATLQENLSPKLAPKPQKPIHLQSLTVFYYQCTDKKKIISEILGAKQEPTHSLAVPKPHKYVHSRLKRSRSFDTSQTASIVQNTVRPNSSQKKDSDKLTVELSDDDIPPPPPPLSPINVRMEVRPMFKRAITATSSTLEQKPIAAFKNLTRDLYNALADTNDNLPVTKKCQPLKKMRSFASERTLKKEQIKEVSSYVEHAIEKLTSDDDALRKTISEWLKEASNITLEKLTTKEKISFKTHIGFIQQMMDALALAIEKDFQWQGSNLFFYREVIAHVAVVLEKFGAESSRFVLENKETVFESYFDRFHTADLGKIDRRPVAFDGEVLTNENRRLFTLQQLQKKTEEFLKKLNHDNYIDTMKRLSEYLTRVLSYCQSEVPQNEKEAVLRSKWYLNYLCEKIIKLPEPKQSNVNSWESAQSTAKSCRTFLTRIDAAA